MTGLNLQYPPINEDLSRHSAQMIPGLKTTLTNYHIHILATDSEARVRFPALPEKKVVGLKRGPLSLVSTTEELLDRKVAAPV
jgi:hypothetical protein